jgi:hypothetical protein
MLEMQLGQLNQYMSYVKGWKTEESALIPDGQCTFSTLRTIIDNVKRENAFVRSEPDPSVG